MTRLIHLKGQLAAALVFCCLSAGARAEVERPNDFAFGAPVTTGGDHPFYRLALPHETYLSSAWSDLRDVRVFDNQGRSVPFALYQPTRSGESVSHFPLALFALDGRVSQGEGRNKVVTLRLADGSRVELPLQQNETVGGSYLISLPQQQHASRRIDRLTFGWTPTERNWQARVTLYYSDDLKNWYREEQDAPLLDLQADNQRLRVDHINLDGRAIAGQAYLLAVVTGDGGQTLPTFSSVQGSTLERHIEEETVALSFNGQPLGPDEAEYQLPVAQPLSQLIITPQLTNRVLPLAVSYRSGDQEPWTPLPNQLVYRFIKDGNNSQSAPIALNQTLIKSVRLKGINSQWGETPPQLTGARPGRTVIFNAQGNPPYLLAWGARQAAPQALTLDELIPQEWRGADSLAALPLASAGDRLTLGGASRLTEAAPVAGAPARWPVLLLWGLLIVGTLGLGLLAFKLWREMNTAR
ncbi:DUF3999 domain-containing protein [Affinibrenneria salicis]|uniref:DUF3999 domain-containing protein n=1 Tax=Affinibrenneria salicis TaxID=2590031 RepID=A0A5J5G546_9GAMM|nr:DUF3999 family protein [Affinibrenneria salicis]KAA9001994.1 DUF3999 domain-containing protein [Affinibrenneria salicis]